MSTPSIPPPPALAGAAAESGSLAHELARGYAQLIEDHRFYLGLDPAEAAVRIRGDAAGAIARLPSTPPDQVRWGTMATAMEQDPAAAAAAWERLKAAARAELRSGHRAAAALEWQGMPWDRARFLVLREAFVNDWRPRGGVESALVEVLAESFAAYLRWTERGTAGAETASWGADRPPDEEGSWQPPRISTAEWLKWCADQAERAHKRFLMTIKVLQDLRRLPAVRIATAGQVNVARQQVNIAPTPGEGEAP